MQNGENEIRASAAATQPMTLLTPCRSFVHKLLQIEPDPRKAFGAVAAYALKLPELTSSTLFLPSTKKNAGGHLEIVAKAGTEDILSPSMVPMSSASLSASGVYSLENNLSYVDIRWSGKIVGKIGIKHKSNLNQEVIECLNELAWACSIIFEKQRLYSEILIYRERLEVLSELNQLVVSGSDLGRISKTISREAAFRFGADAALILLLSENRARLTVSGSYGCPRKQLPDSIPVSNTFLGNSLRLGGMLSVPDLASKADAGLSFLMEIDIKCLHTCTLDVKGQTVGLIVAGFKQSQQFNTQNSMMLGEFARAAAVAVENSKSQERVTAYTERLEELVEQRTADLAVQMSESEKANMAKSRFVANMSHELRTPLTAIVGYASVLIDDVYGETNLKQKEALGAITKSSEHLRELIDEVLNLSKIEAGKDVAEPSAVELVSLLKQTYKLMIQSARSKELEFIGVPETIDSLKNAKLWVDPRHIRQILINLISNAIKYTPQKGRIRIEAEPLGDKIKISVIDSGIGISTELQQRLFTRFERGVDTYSQNQTGTGIGLSLTRRLIELNGGKIGVTSQEGEGSTFWILVPLHQSENQQELENIAENPKKVENNLDGLNILIVDDNETTCQVLEAIVTRGGAEAFCATSVAQAKEISKRNEIDAALVDLAIPGKSGLDLIEFFRKQSLPPLSTMPLIVVSACVFDSDRERAMESGASDFIPKPFRPNEIVKSIRDLTTKSVLHSGTYPVLGELNNER